MSWARSCLVVYAALAVAFSPEHPWKLMLALYLVGIVLGTLVGLVLKRTLLPRHSGTLHYGVAAVSPAASASFLRHAFENLSLPSAAGKFIVPMMLVLGILTASMCMGTRAK